MQAERAILEEIKSLVAARKYRTRIHAVRHMVEEGFDEKNLVEALCGKSRLLELYPTEDRCLIQGQFEVSEGVRQALHIVCDFSNPVLVDIVTAYLPRKPWWITPSKRGRLI